MKAINNFIVEQLEYSTFPINEKLKISSRSNIYTCQPKNKYELRKILEERLAKDKNADLNNIDVSEITDMGFQGFIGDRGLFEDLDPHDIDISEWNVSNVTDMVAMFIKCKNFTGKGLENWDVSKVITTAVMFSGCVNFTGKGIENWDVSKVKDMSFMFDKCKNFNADLNKWDVSNVTSSFNMYAMFRNCDSLKNYPSWYK